MIRYLKKIILFMGLILLPINVLGDSIKLYSNNVLVYNLDENKILYSENEKDKISIASLTKIMTVIVSLENINNLDETIKFPKINYLYEYSRVGFETGDELTYRDLLYSAILPSAADATEGLAILISGSTNKFVDLMNDKAKELGMNNTHFSNTYGKDSENNYSTLNDLLTLMIYALDNPEFYKIFTTKSYTLSSGKTINNSISYYNRKSNLDITPIIGNKTGFTDDSGYCMISIYKKGEAHLLIITTNADSKINKPTHLIDNLNIGNYYVENYKYFYILREGEYIGNIKILGIKEKIYSEDELKLYLPDGIDIETEFKDLGNISFTSKVGDKVGEYIIKYDNEVITKDIKIPNTFRFKFLLFLSKYLTIVYLITRILLFI